MARILAIDPGTHCGWAIRNGNMYYSGTWDLSTGRFSGGGMRYLRFCKFLDEAKLSTSGQVFDAVYFEEVRAHKGTDAAHVYGGIVAHLMTWCEQQQPKIPYQGIPVSHVKRAATGKGGGKGTDKPAMVAAAKLAWPEQDIKDDNQADALWILRSAETL
jgi:Holliday junction resolvasome RuvABC endonuclease subunit